MDAHLCCITLLLHNSVVYHTTYINRETTRGALISLIKEVGSVTAYKAPNATARC